MIDYDPDILRRAAREQERDRAARRDWVSEMTLRAELLRELAQ